MHGLCLKDEGVSRKTHPEMTSFDLNTPSYIMFVSMITYILL